MYIWRVEPNSLADRNGIKSGDEILSANAIDFNNISHGDALKVMWDICFLNLAENAGGDRKNVTNVGVEYGLKGCMRI